jgi:crotonobetainyl-CoA:carnitine CoA-transferase CaiB-like acyl-CoA transferase
MAARRENSEACVRVLDEVFGSRTYAEWCDAFRPERFPWGPYQRVTEIPDDPQVVANGYIGDVEVDGGEPFRLPTGAVQFDEHPTALRRGPEHGQHTEEVLLELGYDWDRIIELKEHGVVT